MKTPRTDAKAYTPFEDDMNEEIVSADFARTLELELARKDALLREALGLLRADYFPIQARDGLCLAIERELGGKDG